MHEFHELMKNPADDALLDAVSSLEGQQALLDEGDQLDDSGWGIWAP